MWNLSDEYHFFFLPTLKKLIIPYVPFSELYYLAVRCALPGALLPDPCGASHHPLHSTLHPHCADGWSVCFVQSNFAVSSFLTLSGRAICPMSFWGTFIYHQWPRFFVNLILFSQEVYTVWWLWLLRDFTISANPSVEIWWDKLTKVLNFNILSFIFIGKRYGWSRLYHHNHNIFCSLQHYQVLWVWDSHYISWGWYYRRNVRN